MYYKDIEKFTAFRNIERYGSDKDRRIPLWLLILIIVILVVAAAMIIRKIRFQAPAKETFGFRFY